MITCVVITDTQTWIIIIVGVILVYKELTTSVVPYVPTTISRMVTYWFYTMYVVFCISIQNWDSIGNQSYMSESSDLQGYVITTSINCRDRWFWTANDISYRMRFHLWRIVGYLREPLCYNTCSMFHHLVVLNSVSRKNWCRYCLWIPSHYWARSFLPRLYPFLEFSLSVVHTLPWPWSLDLNHLKGFCNLVEKCMLTIVDFWLYDSPGSI